MIHPKMLYTYVGVDSHKDTHTAVFLDCFFEKLGELQFENLPSKFEEFFDEALKLEAEGTTLFFGLEDTSAYGRNLTAFILEKGYSVKHVNAFLVSRERKNRNITVKSDAVDAECAARVLLSKLDDLPDAKPDDLHWMLRTLVVRRDFLVKNNGALKNCLHNLLTQHYPNYRSFFENIDCNASLAFFLRFPSPAALEGTSLEELAAILAEPSGGKFGEEKAQTIMDSIQDTAADRQEIRDMTVRSTVRQLRFNLEELENMEEALAQILALFNCTLTSMKGLDTISAAQLLSCIGDVRKFPTPAKLARYAGIAPATFSSGKKETQYASKRGNRELNSIFYGLSVRLTMTAGSKKRVVNPFFFDYYHKKLADGKTKAQALKCVQRRLVNIVWSMLTNGEEYVNPPTYNV